MTETIYADCNATWPVSADHGQRVIERLIAADGNPSSIHGAGREAKIALEDARSKVAELAGVESASLFFTSGATESNNLILQGYLDYVGRSKVHILAAAIEHPAILDAAQLLAERDFIEFELLPVDSVGRVDPEQLVSRIRPDTRVVAVMHANNEVGCINDVRYLADQAKTVNPNLHFHSDMVQSLGKFDLSWLRASAVDSAAFSAHKIGGFKGVGALYLRQGIKLNALMAGGGQERARRPGTENLAGIYSFADRAEELSKIGLSDFWQATSALKVDLIERLSIIEGCEVHGDPMATLPNTLNFHIDGIAGDDLLLNLDLAGIQASTGSACSSGSNRPSTVLKALGYPDSAALNSIRLSFLPQYNNHSEIADRIYQVIASTVSRVRN